MIENENLKMTEILVGIRHKRNFSVLDKFGEIVDKTVDNPKFPKGYFDEVGSEGITKSISNSLTKNYIKFTQFDLIYRHQINEKSSLEDECNIFFERVKDYIVPDIIEEYKIKDFSRIGIVYGFEFKNKTFYDKCIKNIINKNFSNTNSIRFSEKDLTPKGRIFKGTNDYINKLYSLAIDDNNKAVFSYDYQYYFSPLKSIFKQCEFEKVVELSKNALEKDILKISGDMNETKKA